MLQVVAQEFSDFYEEAIYLSACELSRWEGALSELVASHIMSDCDSTFFVEPIAKKIWIEQDDDLEILEQCSGGYLPRQIQNSRTLLMEHTGLGLITQFAFWLEGNRYGGKVNALRVNNCYRHIDLHEQIDLHMGKAYWNLS